MGKANIHYYELCFCGDEDPYSPKYDPDFACSYVIKTEIPPVIDPKAALQILFGTKINEDKELADWLARNCTCIMEVSEDEADFFDVSDLTHRVEGPYGVYYICKEDNFTVVAHDKDGIQETIYENADYYNARGIAEFAWDNLSKGVFLWNGNNGKMKSCDAIYVFDNEGKMLWDSGNEKEDQIELRDKMKEEALERIRRIGLIDKPAMSAVEEFRKGNVLISKPALDNKIGVLYKLNEAENRLVESVEKEYGIMVYHVIQNRTETGMMYSMLYVSTETEEWEMDMNDISAGNDMNVYAYVVNAGNVEDGANDLEVGPDSEFGVIGICKAMGGLCRFA